MPYGIVKFSAIAESEVKFASKKLAKQTSLRQQLHLPKGQT